MVVTKAEVHSFGAGSTEVVEGLLVALRSSLGQFTKRSHQLLLTSKPLLITLWLLRTRMTILQMVTTTTKEVGQSGVDRRDFKFVPASEWMFPLKRACLSLMTHCYGTISKAGSKATGQTDVRRVWRGLHQQVGTVPQDVAHSLQTT